MTPGTTRAAVAAIAAAHAALAAGAAGAGGNGGREPVEPARGIRSVLAEPVAVRGGVLMVPLAAERPGNQWPATMRLGLADGRRIEGLLAWVTPGPDLSHAWTAEPAAAVRPIAPDDDTSAGAAAGAGAPYLLARLPRDGDGQIRLPGGQRLRPRWLAAAPAAPGGATSGGGGGGGGGGPLDAVTTDDRPDPLSPCAHWRWELLADRLGVEAPSADRFGDGVERLAAEHFAALWRAALARLGGASPGVASACRDLLTATCLDGDRTIAAWVADPRRTGALLALLLDPAASGQALVESALRWADGQESILVWPERGDDRRVTVAFANPTWEPAVATLAWDRGDQIPIAVELAPARVSRVAVDRPPEPPGALGGALTDPAPGPLSTRQLVVEVAGWSRRLAFHRPLLTATPPGVFFPALQPPMSLLETQTGIPAPIDTGRATLAHLRRREGRWEMFFECRRPAAGAGAAAPAVGGGESVTLLLGADEADGAGGAAVALTVPEQGAWQVAGGSDDGTLQVHRRSAADRWLCRLVLPDAWLPVAAPEAEAGTPAAPLLVGMIRRHGDSDAIETGPYRSPPWRIEPGRAAIELDGWDRGD